jgi:hypothetical protein
MPADVKNLPDSFRVNELLATALALVGDGKI